MGVYYGVLVEFVLLELVPFEFVGTTVGVTDEIAFKLKVWPLTIICGVPEETCTAETTPVTAPPPVEGVADTVSPISPVAWMFCRSDCICWEDCKELNCASCAAKAVSLWGFSGSCDVIWVTSRLRKSAWLSDCGELMELAEVVDEAISLNLD
jgi:hypothetical protein